MRRFRPVLSSSLVMALVSSLFFVPGSFAEPLGAGLLASFGVGSSGQSDTQAATRSFDLPVTVSNTSSNPVPMTVTNTGSNPVPVTVHGDASDPLTATIDGTVNTLATIDGTVDTSATIQGTVDTSATINGTVNTNATIDGTVDTRDVNDPTAQPFQLYFTMNFAEGSALAASDPVVVPAGKRMIIRHVSGSSGANVGQTVVLEMYTKASGEDIAIAHQLIPPALVQTVGLINESFFGNETWFAVDPGTTFAVVARRYGGTTNPDTVGVGTDVFVAGYYVDVP